jgi:hypothetical protein
VVWLSCLLVAAVSCGGDGVIVDTGGPPAGEAPTLASLQSSFFSPKCALPACHAAPSPQQGMELSPGHTYVLTVGVDSTELPAFERVASGNAADSYLYMKLAGDPRIVGDRMPLDGIATAAEIEAVRAWIDAGAKDD